MSNETESGFYRLSWEQYQSIADDLSNQIRNLDINFDFIVPIMRGGTILAISLSHSLGITRIYPVQYKYVYENIEGKELYHPIQMFSSIPSIKSRNKPYTILVTEGNHSTGVTSQECINHIRSFLPNCQIYYVSIGRDYAHQERLKNTSFELWGMQTNERKTLTIEECMELGIQYDYMLYPWENLEEELAEIIASK